MNIGNIVIVILIICVVITGIYQGCKDGCGFIDKLCYSVLSTLVLLVSLSFLFFLMEIINELLS